ncbi:toll/interleukin-1 receptor domain-containing protein [Streptomyces sp. XD-27]|uniref:tetratricopeptide repeat protein n=1 Tax=Streptomyces sp. XD-27 TaxID=3062779 RepID=UPI0026F47E2A|nr:toll/interleukin-1 receptor domain-containing protein [Streptomyces sp. XD-27]WKX69751.1 toll/interleukin-1 receptor domain-containing protein [Streptomyces sp. XD-27]
MEGREPRVWDVFLSYSRGDAERVRPLRARLVAAGLRVFVDEATVAGFTGISEAIRDGLARSKALLAVYSAAYPERRACQWELTAAHLAGLREGDPRRRVMVVNPEPSAHHIHPVELRDAKHWPLPTSDAALDALVADVRAHVAAIGTPMGQLPMATTVPRWLPGPPPPPAVAFTGRLPQLWQVHSALHSHAAPLTTGQTSAGPVQIRGMAGIGKTLLAREYATRFAAAYPGGIHWLALREADADVERTPYGRGLAYDAGRGSAYDAGDPAYGADGGLAYDADETYGAAAEYGTGSTPVAGHRRPGPTPCEPESAAGRPAAGAHGPGHPGQDNHPGQAGGYRQDGRTGAAGSRFPAYERALRAVVRALGLPDDGPAETLTAHLHTHFARSGLPFLWVVDGLPDHDGLTARRFAALTAPHPLGRTLVTTRSRRYDSLAAPVELGPLTDEESYALLTRAEPPRGEHECAAARRLCTAVDGHPLALDLLGSATADGYHVLHDRFHAPGSPLLDSLARGSVLPTGHPVEVTSELVRDAVPAGPCALDVLRLAAAISPLPLVRDEATRALALADGMPPVAAARRVDAGVAALRARNLLVPAARSWCVHPVIAHAWLRHDPEPARAERLRHAVIRALRSPYGPPHGSSLGGIGARPRPGTREPQMPAPQPESVPSELERMAAFDIQVELATRIGVQELAPQGGSLREALASLHAMFEFTRSTLRQYSISLAPPAAPDAAASGAGGAAAGGDRTVHAIAYDLLNRILRPFLTEWHPRLAAHEAARPVDGNPIQHEQAWAQAAALRTALAELRTPLLRITGELSAISGADFGLAPAG